MITDAHSPLPSQTTPAQFERKQRLQWIVREGLPPFRQTALELTKALGGASPDMKKAGQLISADPSLSSQVLRMCNSPLLGLHSRVISIDHAASLLGPERLRSLALTTSVADFAGKALPDAQMNSFWRHSFMAAMLSQHLAEQWDYFEKHQAYIAGLLHDIGQIPEWMLLVENAGNSGDLPSNWLDNTEIEREYFGTDHCQLGGTMARFWDLMPSFLDVLENHHTPELARRDSVLVRIVATADNFLRIKPQTPPPEGSRLFEEEALLFVELGQGLFGESKWPQVAKALEQEYTRILPIADAGISGILSGSTSKPEPSSESDSRTARLLNRDPEAVFPTPSSQPEPAQTRVQPLRSGSAPTTFLSRCKSFIKQLVS